MSEGGSIQKQLTEATKALDEEMELWQQEQMTPYGWRMADYELLFRCEILVLMEVVMEKLEITQQELDLRLKRTLLTQMQQLRPKFVEMRKQEVMQRLTDGIRIKPPKPDIDGAM